MQIAFDTNVLIRHYLTDPDEPHQSHVAHALVEDALESGSIIYLSHVVLVEAIWVLRSRYKLPKKSMIAFLRSTITDAPFTVPNPVLVDRAIKRFARSKADFADCLIAAEADEANCHSTYSFDQNLDRLSGVTVIQE